MKEEFRVVNRRLHSFQTSASSLAELLEGCDASTLVELTAMHSSVLSSLQGLERSPLLHTLRLSCNCIQSLGGCPALALLTSLDLQANQLTSLAGIERLTSLKHLNAARNRIQTWQGLAQLPKLEKLILHANALQAWEDPLPSVRELVLRNGQLSNPICQDEQAYYSHLAQHWGQLVKLDDLPEAEVRRLWERYRLKSGSPAEEGVS